MQAYLIPDTTESRPRRERISSQVRMRLNPRALTSIGIEQQNPLKTKRTKEDPLTYSLFPFHQRYIKRIRHGEQRTKQMGAKTRPIQTWSFTICLLVKLVNAAIGKTDDWNMNKFSVNEIGYTEKYFSHRDNDVGTVFFQ